jgi:hypothetical protein
MLPMTAPSAPSVAVSSGDGRPIESNSHFSQLSSLMLSVHASVSAPKRFAQSSFRVGTGVSLRWKLEYVERMPSTFAETTLLLDVYDAQSL